MLKRYPILLTVFVLLSFIIQCGKKQSTRPEILVNTVAVCGTIRDAEDQTVLEMAMIMVQPGAYIAYSDSLGKYCLMEIPEGQYDVITSKEKFNSDTSALSVYAGDTVFMDVDLDPEFDVLKWQYHTDGPIYYSTPAIDDEGTIYVGTGRYLGTTSGSLYAVYPNGTLKWKYTLENNACSAVIGEDGTIYMMDRKNILYAFDNTGRVKWQYNDWELNDFAEVGQRTVSIGYDNTLYVYVGFDLYALNPDGTRQWIFDPGPSGTPCGASPAIGRDSTIYAILGGEILYAVRPDGSLKWKFYLETYDEHSYTSVALDENDVIYFGTENWNGGYVYAVYPSGILKWRIYAGHMREVRASPAIGMDGTVYTATMAYSHRQPAEVLAIGSDGNIRWRFTLKSVHFTDDDAYSTPTIGADGLIYAAAETGFVYALNPDGSLNWKQDFHCGINWSSPTLIEDGTLYIGIMINEGGSLLALQTQSMGLADSAWPTFKQNNKHRGRSNAF